MRSPSRRSRQCRASEVVHHWKQAGPAMWFAKDPVFDADLRRRFLPTHERAADGALLRWLDSAEAALALVLLLDQFPRNAFRGTPRMYATDPLARRYAESAIEARFDDAVGRDLRVFFYLPFAHSERLADQDRSVKLHRRLGYVGNAERHRDIVRRFGRFPHRNAILGRTTTPEEHIFLDNGGFAG